MMLSAVDVPGNINLIKRLAKSVYPNNQILEDMTVVQAILEGGLQKSPPSQLAFKYCNLFGIKRQGTKGMVTLMTHEFYGGKMHQVPQAFAWNGSVEDSIFQHKQVLEMDRYKSVREAKTFEEAAKQIRLDGYATDPQYSQLLIDTYKRYCQ